MSPQQIALLRRLLIAEREARVGDGSRWVEVGRFVGIDPRTVESLVNTGLVETTSENGMTTLAALRRDLE